jgi:RNA polymerase sigma-70 factor (ECF subfamily)
MAVQRSDKPRGSGPEGGVSVVVPLFPAPPEGASRDRRQHLSALFSEHQQRLVRFLTAKLGSIAEAQDAAQETYLRLLEQTQSAPDTNLRALLYITARNIATDRQRQQWKHGAGDIPPESIAREVRGPERILAGRQDLLLLAHLIEQLPPKCRDAFVAYKFYDMSYHEIAQRMGLTESMVRKYVLRAIAYCSGHMDAHRGAS